MHTRRAVKKIEWLGYQIMKKLVDMFTHFDTMQERYRLTDGQTLQDGKAALRIASCGKAVVVKLR